MSRADIIKASIADIAERLQHDKELREETEQTERIYRQARRRMEENQSEMGLLCEALDTLTSNFRFTNMSMPDGLPEYKDVERHCARARDDRRVRAKWETES